MLQYEPDMVNQRNKKKLVLELYVTQYVTQANIMSILGFPELLILKL